MKKARANQPCRAQLSEAGIQGIQLVVYSAQLFYVDSHVFVPPYFMENKLIIIILNYFLGSKANFLPCKLIRNCQYFYY